MECFPARVLRGFNPFAAADSVADFLVSRRRATIRFAATGVRSGCPCIVAGELPHNITLCTKLAIIINTRGARVVVINGSAPRELPHLPHYNLESLFFKFLVRGCFDAVAAAFFLPAPNAIRVNDGE